MTLREPARLSSRRRPLQSSLAASVAGDGAHEEHDDTVPETFHRPFTWELPGARHGAIISAWLLRIPKSPKSPAPAAHRSASTRTKRPRKWPAPNAA